jgi:ABC-type lipoprotein export system ATPase subunit
MNDPLPHAPASIADAHAPPPLVEARDASKSYQLGRRTLEVLRGVDLIVKRGEIVALRGASGAGKSTLLHLIGGLDTPSGGQIWIDRVNVAEMKGAELAEFRIRRVGFVFQAYHLLPDLDALENVCLPARIARRPAREAEDQARRLMRRVGLEDRLDHKPTELSGGEQQRVAIARALINEPELLLADEPTGNLDQHTGQEIIELLLELRAERQTTLIIATHDARVAAHSPRILDLVDGRIAGAIPC